MKKLQQQKEKDGERGRNDDGTRDQSWLCLPVRVVTYTVEGSSRVVRNHQEQEQIRYRLLVLMRPHIDQ